MAKLVTRGSMDEFNGTSFHDQTIRCSYNELVATLGTPQAADNNGEDKVNFCWYCKTTGGRPFTIYDWKEYRPLRTDERIEWHIGGHSGIDTQQARKELELMIY